MGKGRPSTLKDYLHEWLSTSLRHLAFSVASRPKTYIFVPVVISCISALGILRAEFSNDIEAMFTGKGTRMDQSFHAFKEYFEKDPTREFYPGRIVEVKSFARILVMMKNAQENGNWSSTNILDEEPYAEVLKVDAFVRDLTLTDEVGLKYADLCAHHRGRCLPSPALQIGESLPKIRSNETELTFPVFIDEEDPLFGTVFLPGTLGKPKLRRESTGEEDAIVESSAGLSLTYVLNASTPRQLQRAKQWEYMIDEKLGEWSSDLKHVDVYFFTASTFTRESNEALMRMSSVFAYAGIVLFFFALVSGVMKDPIQSKPYFSLAGILNAGCAILTTWGICSVGGMPFMGLSAAAPLLLLGVGFDDTFVLLGAWRNTKKTKSAAERLADAYSEAAVSLFITTFTDVICFVIGSLTPYPGINYFCILAGVGMLLLLAYQLTFFGALMYLMGEVECDNRDALTFQKVFVASSDDEATGWQPWRCPYYLKAGDMTKKSEPYLMAFFRDVWGKLLMTRLAKFFVMILFAVYLATSVHLALQLETTFERRFLTNEDTPAAKYIAYEEEYFFDWPGRPMIAVLGYVDYSNKTVQKDMELLLGEIENNRFFADSLYSESWLRGFTQFVKMNEYYETIDISTEEAFIKELKARYLSDDDGGMSTDVVFSEDGTKIVASRFIVQLSNLQKFGDFSKAMSFLWRICDMYSDRYDIRVFHPAFKWTEQNVDILPYSIMTVLSAMASVLGISLLLIPKASVSLWIALSIISSTIGVVGYMHLWNLSLNLITMIGLLLGTGFAVDFTAHISYAYAVSKESRPSDRMRDALYRLGLPMLQGGASTILSLACASLVKTYALKTLVKMMCLVFGIGILHGLVFFPVLLVLASDVVAWWQGKLSKSSGSALTEVIARHANQDDQCLRLEFSPPSKVPVMHLACERSYFRKTVQNELLGVTGGCCGDLISSSGKEMLKTSVIKGQKLSKSAEQTSEPDPVLFVPSSTDTDSDKLIFYPAMIVLSRTDCPQLEANFSSIQGSQLCDREAMIAAAISFSPKLDERMRGSSITLGTTLGSVSSESSSTNSPNLSSQSSAKVRSSGYDSTSIAVDSASDRDSPESHDGHTFERHFGNSVTGDGVV